MSPNGVSPRVYYIYRRERTSNGVGVNNSSTRVSDRPPELPVCAAVDVNYIRPYTPMPVHTLCGVVHLV